MLRCHQVYRFGSVVPLNAGSVVPEFDWGNVDPEKGSVVPRGSVEPL